ncbi:MAG: roadblock/LC7 domain-containing protein [Moraxellaceae bacterium]|nr:roadblock/LC7 domain-containing protein [Moraxellaceae bacterium]
MSNTISSSANAKPKDQCERELEQILAKHPAIFFISLASVDGRSFAHVQGGQPSDAGRIAAMTSSLLGLSESYAREASASRCRYSVVAMESGSVVTVRIPTKSLRFALAIGANDSENIATILRAALDGASALSKLLDGFLLQQPKEAGV